MLFPEPAKQIKWDAIPIIGPNVKRVETAILLVNNDDGKDDSAEYKDFIWCMLLFDVLMKTSFCYNSCPTICKNYAMAASDNLARHMGFSTCEFFN